MKNKIYFTADESDYFSQIIADGIAEINHNHTAFCFKKSQATAIQKATGCNVTYKEGTYTLVPLKYHKRTDPVRSYI